MGSSDDAATTTTALKKKGVFGYEEPNVAPLMTPEATSLTSALFGSTPLATPKPVAEPMPQLSAPVQPVSFPQPVPQQNILSSLGLPTQAAPQAVAAHAAAPGLQNNAGLDQAAGLFKRLRGNQNMFQG